MFSIEVAPLYIPTRAQGFSLHILPAFGTCLFYDNHAKRYEYLTKKYGKKKIKPPTKTNK